MKGERNSSEGTTYNGIDYGSGNGVWVPEFNFTSALGGEEIMNNISINSNFSEKIIQSNNAPLINFIGLRDGWIPEFESSFMDGKGAMTSGPFIIYPTGGSTEKYYYDQEPGHVLQYYILGPVLYNTSIILPSLFSARFDPENHLQYPWEKSADKLWEFYNYCLH